MRLEDLRRLEEIKLTMREALGSPWLVIDLIEQNLSGPGGMPG